MENSHQNVCNFLQELQNSANSNSNSAERQRAVTKLTEILQNRKVYLIKNSRDLKEAADEMMKAKERLEDIQRQLHLLIKSGGISQKMH
ncbi:MAG: hypothetical protein CO093_09715 [Alphaproteobacteria bacterium CG_4_9_14_3_um_filter_47_13]|nr:MAG: hypothetical protein CO093_09715 [Alphaproteobacteria bacterium CG_4_9_14_3_um_filter_47_13]